MHKLSEKCIINASEISGVDMLHFPKLAYDESLYSLIGRMAHLNGVDDHLRMLRSLLKDPGMSSFIGSSFELESFSVGTNGLYGNADQISYKATFSSLLTHLGCSIHQENHGAKGLWFRGGCVEGGNNTFRQMRFCESCINDDIESLGFSYWRREHQLQTSQICLNHLQSLKMVQIPARRLSEHLWRVEELFEEATFMQPRWDFERSVSIASLGRSILTDESRPHDYRTIRSVITDELRIKGLISKAGKLREDLIHAFRDELKPNTKAGFDREIRTLINSYHSFTLTPWFLLLLIERLFGNWSLFKAKCEWISTIGWIDREVLPGSNKNIRDKHRRICLEFIDSEKDLGRHGFIRANYRSFRWLLHHDRRWLDLHLPISGRQVQQSLFS